MIFYYKLPSKAKKYHNLTKHICKKYKFTDKRFEIVLITGSLARNEFSRYSDIDVTIISTEKLNIFSRFDRVINKEINILCYSKKEFINLLLNNPLFNYYTFKHPAFILKGKKLFLRYKQAFYTREIIKKKKKEILEEIKSRLEYWSSRFHVQYELIKDRTIFDISESIHIVKKFLYYLISYVKLERENKIPIFFSEIKNSLSDEIIRVFDYSVSEERIFPIYESVYEFIKKEFPHLLEFFC